MPGSKKSLKKDQALGSRNRSQKTQRMPLKTNQPDNKKKTQTKNHQTPKQHNTTLQGTWTTQTMLQKMPELSLFSDEVFLYSTEEWKEQPVTKYNI